MHDPVPLNWPLLSPDNMDLSLSTGEMTENIDSSNPVAETADRKPTSRQLQEIDSVHISIILKKRLEFGN